jgi:hypothetical protein
LIVFTVDGLALGLVKKFGLTESVNVLDTEKATKEMINWILWEFTQNRKRQLMEKINFFGKTNPVYILRSEKDVKNFLLNIFNK